MLRKKQPEVDHYAILSRRPAFTPPAADVVDDAAPGGDQQAGPVAAGADQQSDNSDEALANELTDVAAKLKGKAAKTPAP